MQQPTIDTTDEAFTFRATWPDRGIPAKVVNKRDGQGVLLQLDSEEYDMAEAWLAWQMTRGCLIEVTFKVIGEDGTDRHTEPPETAHDFRDAP